MGYWWETQVNILFGYTLLAINGTGKGITWVGNTRNHLSFVGNGTRQKKNSHHHLATGDSSRFVQWELVRPYAVPMIYYYSAVI